MMIVADSYGPARPAEFKAARPQPDTGERIVGVVRYCPGKNIDRHKTITPQEYADLRGASIDVSLVGERGTQDWRGGYATGYDDGRWYRDGATRIGYPADAPIYAAADTDVGPGDLLVLANYQRGFNQTCTGRKGGALYADGLALGSLWDQGLIRYPWQTESDGFHGSRTVYVNCVLHQRTSHKLVVSGIDENDVLHPDWGQGTYIEPQTWPAKEDNDVIADMMVAHVAGADGNPIDGRRWVVAPGFAHARLVANDAELKESIAQCQFRGGKVYENPCTEAWIQGLVKAG